MEDSDQHSNGELCLIVNDAFTDMLDTILIFPKTYLEHGALSAFLGNIVSQGRVQMHS